MEPSFNIPSYKVFLYSVLNLQTHTRKWYHKTVFSSKFRGKI